MRKITKENLVRMQTFGETADRPPSRVRLSSPPVCNRPKRETRKPARYTDIAQQVQTPALALSMFNQGFCDVLGKLS